MGKSSLSTFLFFAACWTSSSNAFLGGTQPPITTLKHRSFVSSLSAIPTQQPGESDIDFIKRLTSNSRSLVEETSKSINNESPSQSPTEKKPTGKYQRIEDWEAEKKSKEGEMTWEQRVQFDGQRFGNQVRQNDILQKNLHSFK